MADHSITVRLPVGADGANIVPSSQARIVVTTTGPPGQPGAAGAAGATGAAGPGVAAGGSTHMVLRKSSGSDYATEWHDLTGDYVALSTIAASPDDGHYYWTAGA